MTAAMLVLETDLLKPTSRQNSTRTVLGAMPNRRWARWGRLLYKPRPTRKSSIADLADYFGSIPHGRTSKVGRRAELLIGACCI